MGRTTRRVSTTPSEIQPIRSGVINWLASNPTPPSVQNPGYSSGPSMPAPVGDFSRPQGYNGGPGVGNGNSPNGSGVQHMAPGNYGNTTIGAGGSGIGGFGGYDPNRPPPGYDPRVWRMTNEQFNQPWLYGGGRANPDGTTSYLTPEQYYQATGGGWNGQRFDDIPGGYSGVLSTIDRYYDDLYNSGAVPQNVNEPQYQAYLARRATMRSPQGPATGGPNMQDALGNNLQDALGNNMQGALGNNMQGALGNNMQGALGRTMQSALGTSQNSFMENLQAALGNNMQGAISAQPSAVRQGLSNLAGAGVQNNQGFTAAELAGGMQGVPQAPPQGPPTGGLDTRNAYNVQNSAPPPSYQATSYSQRETAPDQMVNGQPPQAGPQMAGGLPQTSTNQMPRLNPNDPNARPPGVSNSVWRRLDAEQRKRVIERYNAQQAQAAGVSASAGNIFAQPPQMPGRVQVGLTPDSALPPALQAMMIGGVPQVGAGNIDIPGILNLFGADPTRGQIRDVNAVGTQSVDQLGGVNSAFFNNMMGQLSPAFDQRRAEALAAAKEASGNLTGSGYANMLGGAVNRSLGEERADLARYASQGLNTEVGRQLQLAGNNLQAQGMNQGADMGFLNQLLNRGSQRAGLAGSLAQSNQGAQLAASNANAGNWLQAQMANQGANLRAQEGTAGNILQHGLANRGISQGVYGQQAGMDQQRNLEIFNQLMGMSQGNADRFLQLLMSMATGGVGPDSFQATPWGQFLEAAGMIGGQYAGQRWGAGSRG